MDGPEWVELMASLITDLKKPPPGALPPQSPEGKNLAANSIPGSTKTSQVDTAKPGKVTKGRQGLVVPQRAPDPSSKVLRELPEVTEGSGLRLSKPQRQHRIARILEQHGVSSQLQLVELLAVDGVVATVSRDLEDMGAVKVRVPGGELVYAIPELPSDQVAPEDHLRRVFGDWVVDVASSHNLIVLRTPPGSAHVVASALDRASLDEIIGTVAGDDTILVVCNELYDGKAVSERLRSLAGL
jgi:transcriptional regulator of arginine metabolism